MSNFKIGDKVVVVDNDESYPNYEEWASRVGLNRWAGRGKRLSRKDEGIVVAVAPWDRKSSTILLAVENNKQYIIGESGVEKSVEDTRTPAQKAGLVIGERYRIAASSGSSGRGQLVYFTHDGSEQPYFSADENGYGITYTYAPNVTEVTLYVEPKNTVIEFGKVLTEAQIAAIKTLVA